MDPEEIEDSSNRKKNAFWSLVISNPNESCRIKVPKGYLLHVQNAALVCNHTGTATVVKVGIEKANIETVLCTLIDGSIDQCTLRKQTTYSQLIHKYCFNKATSSTSELAFGQDTHIFTVTPNVFLGQIYLSGYYQCVSKMSSK